MLVLLTMSVAPTSALVITGDTPWVLTGTETEFGGLLPSQALALRDLRIDWYNTFGIEPLTLGAYFPYTDYIHQGRHVGALPPPHPPPACNSTGTFLFIGSLEDLNRTMANAAFELVAEQLQGKPDEAHGCWIVPASRSALQMKACTETGQHSYTAVACTGIGELGVVYSVYELSHAMGVNPQAFWVDKSAAGGRIDRPIGLELRTIDTPEVGAVQRIVPKWPEQVQAIAPTFQYRGFFINDEDMLGEFAKDPLGASVFSISMWDKVFEQLLRLKGNCVIIGTAGFPDESSMQLAVRRGLHIAQHHITILGTNSFQWPEGVPYSFAHSRETQLYTWRQLVTQQAAMAGNGSSRHLWTVGYRGLNDYPFWYDEPEFVTDAARGKLISEAINTQVQTTLNHTRSGEFFTYLWSEMTDLFVNGHLAIPDSVSVVHADAGNGYVDARSINLTKSGDGLYFHLSVEGGKQLTETVPPSRIYATLEQYRKRNATKIVIVNLSDLKPVPSGTACIMQYLWDPIAAVGTQTPEAAHESFLKSWLSLQYPASAQRQLLNITRKYWRLPYLQMESLEQHFGEGDLAAKSRQLANDLEEFLLSSNTTLLPTVIALAQQLDALAAAGATEANELLLEAQQLAASGLLGDRLAFFKSHLITQAGLWAGTTNVMSYVAAATLSVAAGNTEAAHSQLVAAVAASEQILGTERDGEQGMFASWHLNDWLDGYASLRDACRATLHAVTHDVALQQRPWRFGTGKWNSFFQYDVQTGSSENFPFFYARPELVNYRAAATFSHAVRLQCASSNCSLITVGAMFSGPSALFGLHLVGHNTNTQIRYCLSADVPTAQSCHSFTSPFVLSSDSNIVTARAFTIDGQALDPMTRNVVNRTNVQDRLAKLT